MKRALKFALLLPIVVLAVALSIANRHEVVFSLDPFAETDPTLSVTVPLYWLLFGAVAIGVLFGGIAAWLRQSRWRRAARRDHAEIERMRRAADERAAAGPAADRTS
ncbi:MAG: LapA family protein [Bauldia sp.]|nr:LapA family protein [Bauldia sp.]MCW5717516.1 LapA family protein [Bauldia sp.]